MRAPLALMKFTAKALLNAATYGLPVGDFVIDVFPAICQDIWDWWGKTRDDEEIRAEIEALVQVSDIEASALAERIVAELAYDQPAEVRQLVTGYLTQMPAMARRSLQRPSDPPGTTVPPNLVLHGADDLLHLLPPKLPRFQPNQRLAGLDWELERFLGVGGFGEVWKARHLYRKAQPPVALKFCLDSAAARLLRNEVELFDRLEGQSLHPGFVRLVATHLNAEPPCLAYEYVEGGDLSNLIRNWHRDGSGPSPSQAAEVILQLAEIVGFAHRLNPPIVHRDLKPANILVAGHQFKITDLGIGGLAAARTIGQSQNRTSQGQFLVSAVRGSFTMLYASKQQMAGALPDPRDDVVALGVIWYQIFTGDLTTGRPSGTRWSNRLAERGFSPEMIELPTPTT